MEKDKENKILNVPALRFPEFTEEWQYAKFKDVVTLQRGSSPRPIINYLTTSDDGVNWVKIGDMPTSGRIVTSTEEKITKEGAKKSRHVSAGDLILSNSMSYGLPYIMGIDGYIHDGWFVLKNYEQTFDRDYLCNLLISDAIQKQYKKLAAGGVVQNISSDLVNSVNVFIPCLDEQKKIAKLLNLIDDRISTQNKIIEKLETLIKGIIETVISSQKPNTLIKNCLECNSSTLQESQVAETGTFPVYGATGISGYTETADINGESILIIKDGSGVGTVKFVTGEYSYIGTLNSLTVKDGYCLKYIYFALQRLSFEPYKTGMAIPHIYFKDYGKAKIFCPTIKEQFAIAKRISSIEDKVSVEKRILFYYQAQKSYLLSQMLI